MSTLDSIFTLIAQKHLGIHTLETRHRDKLDFHTVAVGCLRDALEAAFKAGIELGVSLPTLTGAEISNLEQKALGFEGEQRVHPAP